MILNAGAGLYVSGVAESVADGCQQAANAVKAGKPMDVLAKWVAACQE